MKTYRIYSKMDDQKRFSPVDWAEGVQVVNLIHATIIPEDFFNKAKDVLTKSVLMNKGMTFQLREIESGKTVFEVKNKEV
jgi:hypothetical protein